MGTEPKIISVMDNTDKQTTYRKQMERYTKAMKQEFYLEALVISYAALEDRLRSFLYHMGVIRNYYDNSPNIQKTKKQLRAYYFGSLEEASGKKIDFKNISNKITMINKTVEHITPLKESDCDWYESALKKGFSSIDCVQLLSTLGAIDEWLDYRNEVIHGLLNKNIKAIGAITAEKAKQGMEFVRCIDACVQKLKRKNVRSIMRIPS